MEATQRRAVSHPNPPETSLFSFSLSFPPTRDHLLFPRLPLASILKWLGLVSFEEGRWGSVLPTLVSSQLFLKEKHTHTHTKPEHNTKTNKTVARGSVLRWKTRYKIYLRFLVFVKIESSHFNCSRRGVLLQATGEPKLCVPSLVLATPLFSIVQNADYGWLYPCHLSYLGSFR